MDEKNKIKISYNKNDSQEEIVKAKEQQAATQLNKLQKTHEQTSYSKFNKIPTIRKKLSQSSFKYVSLSIMTALFVSLALGFVLLKLFVSVTEEAAPTQSVSGDQIQTTEASKISIDLPSLEAKVVQSGVYTNEETANEWKDKLSEQSLPSIIWLQNEQYYLLSGSEDKESTVNVLVDELSEMEVPTYLKTWEVESGKIAVIESQSSIVKSVINHLEKHTLHTVPMEERDQMLQSWSEIEGNDEGFSQALKDWVSETENGLSWLAFAQALESMKK
ncbi:hypothetical protein [Halobacillus seohaensis]|uniref:SPOR domain-containing protein n=1 Tax=Halobacillus seohaensis TaxID=447421 RepID=A0ABW2EHL8_9BACI